MLVTDSELDSMTSKIYGSDQQFVRLDPSQKVEVMTLALLNRQGELNAKEQARMVAAQEANADYLEGLKR